MEEAAILENMVAEVMVVTQINRGGGQAGATAAQHGRGNG